MKKDDYDKIVKYEKAISKKYGAKSIANPKSGWTEEKEKKYLEQLKKISQKENKKKEQSEKVKKDGFFISKNLITKKTKRICQGCDIYSFNVKDDLYMNKFECCYRCYIQWVEDREDRWEAGWRPEHDKKE